MAVTASQLIYEALRLNGTLAAPGQVPSPDESTDALRVLNAMLENWSTDRLNIFAIQYAEYLLTTTQASYTMGLTATGTNFIAARPIKIQTIEALVADAGSTTPATDKVRVPIEIINATQWAAISPRTAKHTYPTRAYPDYATPLCNINFWPVPTFTGTAPRVEIYSWVPLQVFADLTTSYSLSPGYELAIESNLAIVLAPGYQLKASQELLDTAQRSLGAIRQFNASNLPPMSFEPPPQGAPQPQGAPA